MSRHVCKSGQETTGSTRFLIRSVFIRSARLVVWWNWSHTHALPLIVRPWEGLCGAARRHFSHASTCKQTHLLRYAHTPLFVPCSILPSVTLRYGCRVYISSVSIIRESFQDSRQLWKKRLYLNYLHLDLSESCSYWMNLEYWGVRDWGTVWNTKSESAWNKPWTLTELF